MKPKETLAELERAAKALDVTVSYESIASSLMRGGLCKVKGQYRVIIDKRLTPEERSNTLAEALSRLGWGQVEDLHAEVADLLGYYAQRQAS